SASRFPVKEKEMKVRLAIPIALVCGLLNLNPRLAETAVNLDVQQLRYNTRYTCNGDTIIVTHCRHQDDTPEFPPTKPEDDYCRVSYPDRPLRNGFRVETVELLSDVIKKLQSCGASNAPAPVTPSTNVGRDKIVEAYLTQGD